jgi:hypothetical protein
LLPIGKIDTRRDSQSDNGGGGDNDDNNSDDNNKDDNNNDDNNNGDNNDSDAAILHKMVLSARTKQAVGGQETITEQQRFWERNDICHAIVQRQRRRQQFVGDCRPGGRVALGYWSVIVDNVVVTCSKDPWTGMCRCNGQTVLLAAGQLTGRLS